MRTKIEKTDKKWGKETSTPKNHPQTHFSFYEFLKKKKKKTLFYIIYQKTLLSTITSVHWKSFLSIQYHFLSVNQNLVSKRHFYFPNDHLWNHIKQNNYPSTILPPLPPPPFTFVQVKSALCPTPSHFFIKVQFFGKIGSTTPNRNLLVHNGTKGFWGGRKIIGSFWVVHSNFDWPVEQNSTGRIQEFIPWH